MTATRRIAPRATSEYSPLKTVIMCMANPFDLDFANLPAELIDEVSLYQTQRNDMRPYNVDKVRAQQKNLISVLEENGAKVLLADPMGSGIFQHYTRDVGFAIHDLFFVGRPRREYRQAELEGLNPVVERIENVHRIERGCIEGGDVLVDANVVLIGKGEETNSQGVNAVIGVLRSMRPEIEVKTLTFSYRGVVHTDTLFNIIGPNLAIIHRPSFIDSDVAWLANRFEFIDATEEEARSLAINTLAIGDGKIVMLAPGGRLADEVAKRGLEPILIDYSEVAAVPGSFRCTTLPVVRG